MNRIIYFYAFFAVFNLGLFLLWTYVPLPESYDATRTVCGAIAMFLCGLCAYAAWENYYYYTTEEEDNIT